MALAGLYTINKHTGLDLFTKHLKKNELLFRLSDLSNDTKKQKHFISRY